MDGYRKNNHEEMEFREQAAPASVGRINRRSLTSPLECELESWLSPFYHPRGSMIELSIPQRHLLRRRFSAAATDHVSN